MSTPARRRLMRDFKRSDTSHKRLYCVQVACTGSSLVTKFMYVDIVEQPLYCLWSQLETRIKSLLN